MNLGPTCTLSAAAAQPWDAVVIGAGPAGSAAAQQLATAGARTLLVDGKRFPRAKVCGGCVNGHALALVHAMGLERSAIEDAGIPIHEWSLRSQDLIMRLPVPEGRALSRARFDAALASAAIRAGAEFLPATTATVCAVDGIRSECRRVELTSAGDRVTVQARVVLAADGLGHPSLRRCPEFQTDVASASRIGLGAIVHDFPADYSPGTIFMAFGRGGYAGLARIEDGGLNLAVAADPEFVRACGGPAGAAARLLREARLPPIAALTSAPWQGTPPLSRRTRPLAANRIFLLGDAAGYVEPMTGEGIAWALAGAAAVVAPALHAIGRWDERIARDWERAYRHAVERRQWTCRAISASARHPRLAQSLIRLAAAAPQLAAPLVRRACGAPALHNKGTS